MCDSSQDQRARRIPDQEWDAWREKLIRLYVEESLSRNEIIEIMAKEHGFVINDTQLKHRFWKWNVKKNIPDSDMATILYFWREGKSIGKNIRFSYKGHELEDERIERASKRRKISFPPPKLTPSYIKAYTSRHSSPQSPRNAILIDQSSAGVEISEHCLDSVVDSCLNFPHGIGLVEATAKIRDEVMVNTLDVPFIESIEADEQSNPFQTREWGHASYDIGANQLPREHSSWIFPAQPLTAASDRSFRPGFCSLSKSPTIRGENNSRHQILTNTAFQRAVSLRRSPSASPDVEVQGDLPYILEDIDPSTLVLPLQLIKSFFVKDLYFPKHSGHCSNSFNRSSDNFRSVFLHQFAQDKWFEFEFENLVRWSCESYAKAGRKLLTTKKAQNDILDKEIDETSKRQEPMNNCSSSVPKLKARRTGYYVSASPVGVFRATLSTLRYREAKNDSQDNFHKLTIAFMPAENERARGLYVTFLRAGNEFAGPRISPYIKAINVVPDDSEIIRCVKRNDLQGVRMLFERREASPTDVDEKGFSLLSYSLYYGYSDIFQLLLQGGADTQNCRRCTRTLNLIWTIWSYYLETPLGFVNYPVEYLTDFDQCVSMTNAALEYGCDISDTVSYFTFSNALFVIFQDRPGRPRREEALKYLLKIEDDMEQRAENGETLLLRAVTALTPANIKCLKILIEKGVNIHAINAEGRSALHCAFLAPTHCREDEKLSYWEGAPDFLWTAPGEELVEWFDIDDEIYAEDYEDLHYDLDPLARYPHSYDALPNIPNRDYVSTLDCSMDSSEEDFNHDLLLDTPNQDYMLQTDCSMNFSETNLQGTFEPNNLGGACQTNANLHFQGLDDSAINYSCATVASPADDFQENTTNEEVVACAGASSEPGNDESHLLESDFQDDIFAGKSTACANTSSSTDEYDASSETTNDEPICLNDQIRHIMEVLKKRLRFKLLTLLQAGCDPAVLDNYGESPGDYADQLGLWPQWEWALVNAGYVYNEVKNRWIKTQPETPLQ